MSIDFIDIIFCLVMSMIVIMPDLYSLLRDKNRWVPVNCPPFELGDDHHYFMEIAELHKKLIGLPSNIKAITGVMKVTIVDLLVNIPFYHLGYVSADRRYGVLSVRFFNGFFLFLSLIFFFSVLGYVGQIKIEQYVIYVLIALVFVTYPFYFFSKEIFGSIFFNTFNRKHIFKKSYANELTRAVQMSTTAPILIFILGVTMLLFDGGFYIQTLPIIALFIVLLLFAYMPIGIGYSYIIVMFLAKDFFGHQVDFVSFILCLLAIFMLVFSTTKIQFYFLNHCDMTSEVLGGGHVINGRIAFKNFIKPIIILTFTVTLCLIVGGINFYDNNVYFLFFILSAFALPMIFDLHQSDRFWLRGYLVIYSSLLFFLLISQSHQLLLALLAVMLLFALFFHSYINSKYMYDNFTKSAFDKDLLDFALSNDVIKKPIVTDSVQLSFYLQLYSDNTLLFKHFSVQNNGFLLNTQSFIDNSKLCGYSMEDVIAVFKSNFTYRDWVHKRSGVNFFSVEYMSIVKKHTQCFMTTYADFNNALTKDGLFTSYKYADGFLGLAKDMYEKSTIDANNYFIFKTNKY